MARTRQAPLLDDESILVRSLALRLPAQHQIAQHAHQWVQVVYVAQGTLAVEASHKRWLLAARRCLWVPAALEHAVESVREARMLTLYLNPCLARAAASTIELFDVSPLGHELIAECLRAGPLYATDPVQASLAVLVAHELPRMHAAGLDLPLPSDPRALRLARQLLASPDDPRSLAALAGVANASPRTLERLFSRETGLSLGKWRQRSRLQHAARLLSEGRPVSEAAFASGYESVSAFVAAFRSVAGMTPGRFVRSQSS